MASSQFSFFPRQPSILCSRAFVVDQALILSRSRIYFTPALDELKCLRSSKCLAYPLSRYSVSVFDFQSRQLPFSHITISTMSTLAGIKGETGSQAAKSLVCLYFPCAIFATMYISWCANILQWAQRFPVEETDSSVHSIDSYYGRASNLHHTTSENTPNEGREMPSESIRMWRTLERSRNSCRRA